MNFADNKDSESRAGTQFEIKIKPPRQAQEWSYSSHRESIGKALSSPGIRYNKKAIAAQQLVWRVTCVRTWIEYDAKADGTTQR
ncbi:hypothetical protein [Absidia glauca]|uniref:Uncharacterized protein n=1 Tax=Absidia glauca TaxID=4829 RepID=A0A163M789_ABSGL|nr:hypothetical protein [Absidia glauca]